MKTTNAVSVIICSHNGASRIEAVLDALQTQSDTAGFSYEVILVNNASTDDLEIRARACWLSQDASLKIVRENRPGLAYARQTGIEASQFPLICFVDDDNIVSRTFLWRAIQMMNKHPRAAVCGAHGVAKCTGPVPEWLWNGWKGHAVGPQGDMEGTLPPGRHYVYGAGMIIRRSALDDLRRIGFVSLLSGRTGISLSSGEDVELCLALQLLGWTLIQSPALKFQHLMPSSRLTWDYCLDLFYQFGRANAVLGIYSAWLPTSSPYKLLRRFYFGQIIHILLLRLKSALADRRTPTREGDSQKLFARALKGQVDAFRELLRARLLKDYFLRVKALANSDRPGGGLVAQT
ncbi:MAG TPA: glycosyltransferase [Terrimicrobiaceae bacterium]